LDDIVQALGGSSVSELMHEKTKVNVNETLSKLDAGKVTYEKAMAALKFN
jgi:hypothetical protein